MLIPQSRYYESHDLRLHYADWGNEGAPVVILVHGGRDHCRSWDVIARSLQPHFHVLAPDLRGHGDSDWARGGSYPLTDYVYDLTRLVRTIAAQQVILIGHSMGGMVSLIYSGSFPVQVAALAVLDGVTVLPDTPKPPAHERVAKWIGQLDKLHDRAPRRYRTIEDAAAQMVTYNKRLSRDLALHLASHGARQNEDGTYAGSSIPISASPRRNAYGRTITSRSGRGSPVRRCSSMPTKASSPRPGRRAWSAISQRRASRPSPAPDTGCITTGRAR
jgi:pimeloyl-ACP methyl ester carboxylesterase